MDSPKIAAEEDLLRIWTWNSKLPETPESVPVHELIRAQVKARPGETAVEAWDGILSYAELDELSTRLAWRLHAEGVKPGPDAPVIPLCFEKSKWFSIGFLGVMKAGGISTALDISQQPVARLASIFKQIKASIILCSKSTLKRAGTIDGSAKILDIEEALDQSIVAVEQLPAVPTEQTLFVTFTSGSTGIAKGACISHANVCAAVHHQGEKLGFRNARILDFAPYSFDVAWSNMLHTFSSGSCLCIPTSDEMMTDLAGCIERYNATLVNITPTMLRTLERQPVSLSTILLSGEPPGLDLLAKWARRLRLINTYGPAECTFKSAFAEVSPQKQLDSANIGRGTGAVTWLVHPENADELVSVGEIGELLLEGPLVGQGYLHDQEKTAAAFVQDPKWLARGGPQHRGRTGRLYRTGDLVRYTEDGSLSFVGRKDRQAKVRGCRVEIGDVEHHIRKIISEDDVETAVEVCTPLDSNEAILVAFLTSNASHDVAEKLKAVLPWYMIPSAYVHVKSRLPRTATGKTDRKELRGMVASSSSADLLQLTAEGGAKEVLTDPLQQCMQRLWSEVLNVDVESIASDSSFFRLGGDSIRAIRLVRAARKKNLHLTVANVFSAPKLSELAKAVRERRCVEPRSFRPFSLMRDIDITMAKQQVAETCGLAVHDIADVYPCTPFQAGLMAETARRPGDNVVLRSYHLKGDVKLDRFRRAWDEVVLRLPLLRTRIVPTKESQLFQVVFRDSLEWSNAASVTSEDATKYMGIGTPLIRFALTGGAFHLVMHHSIFDGWSRSMMMDMLERAYAGEPLEDPLPFQHFVQYVLRQENDEMASKAWQDMLQSTTAQVFPALPERRYRPNASDSLHHDVEGCPWPESDMTPATVIELAWALLIRMYTNVEDVIVGSVVAGRDSLDDGDCMIGPTAATVPLRVSFDSPNETVAELLRRIQTQKMTMKPYEQIGLSNIRRLGVEAEHACDFQTLLVVHPMQEAEQSQSKIFQEASETQEEDGPTACALSIACQLKSDGVQVFARFDSAVIEQARVQRLLRQFEVILRQLSSMSKWEEKTTSIHALSSKDVEDIKRWNTQVSKTIMNCVHDLISHVARTHPDAQAVHAWDGNLTYEELDILSTAAAKNLVQFLQAAEGDVIPLCFGKSRLTPLAILAVMKAGAASVCLDVTQPEQRLRDIIEQVQPRVLLTSTTVSALAARAAPNTHIIELETLLLKTVESGCLSWSIPKVSPTDTLCIVFTSGSSGQPKGILLSHANFSSALVHQNKALGFNRSSRVLDFASYAFDAAYYNCLHTLYAGGCLCIPSEGDRQEDLSGSICRLGANFANLTPKVAEILDLEALRQLKLLELSGETADTKVVERLRRHTKVRFAYGPAECSVMSTVSSEEATVSNIGRGLGNCCWVVDTHTSTNLIPIGCVGELWIEGPLVGHGYFKDAEKTRCSFFEDTNWLMKAVGRHGRLYRTGDLVKYNVDGTLSFVGRKDSQTKIRGQRIELNEVAEVVRQCLKIPATGHEDSVSVVADVAVPCGRSCARLVAFITPPNAPLMTAQELVDAVRILVDGTEEDMRWRVPSYMVPSLFIPLEKIPLTATGKVDRRHLRTVAEQYQAVLSPPTPPEEHFTKTELRLRATWARILKVEEQTIRRQTSFWSLGDSISAMSLLVAIRKEFGVQMAVSSLTRQNTTLASLSTLIVNQSHGWGVTEPLASQALFDLEAMTKQLQTIACHQTGFPRTRSESILLLTGSTGFLGTQILCDLVARRCFNKVVVLVRAADAEDGLARVRQTAQIAGWWTTSSSQSIEVWRGDLSKDRLGLDEHQWNRLTGKSRHERISTIIHNGAAVHWLSTYETLKPVNVDSTFHLMKATLQSSEISRFVYVSGGKASSRGDSGILEDEAVSGYVKTKCVSENLVLRMADHSGAHGKFAVVKPGLIIGDADRGIANADDFLWRYVLSSIDIRASPEEFADSWLPIADVSSVSNEVVHTALVESAEAFSVVDKGLQVSKFWSAVQTELGTHLDKVDMPTWKEMVQKAIQQEGEAHPLWPVQDFIGPIGIQRSSWLDEPHIPSKADELKMVAHLEQAIGRNVRNVVARKDGGPTSRAAGLLTRSRFEKSEQPNESG